MFDLNPRTLTTTKLHPKLHVNEEIELFDTMSLQGVIYHQGATADSGHYTCKVKCGGRWFYINDTNVNSENHSNLEPYILIYKKNNTSDNNTTETTTSIQNRENSVASSTTLYPGEVLGSTLDKPIKSFDVLTELSTGNLSNESSKRSE